MATARFIAPGHEGTVCTVFGRDFPFGEPVETAGMDSEHVGLLALNPTFEVGSDKPERGRPADREPEGAA
ncbi:MAG TPA: hypothetical protein VG248_02810 [Caulobacteraceae bacterium]|jgi:hypothetical protein|nr:hypothetical protein [Caulobacteraceae bacterium]